MRLHPIAWLALVVALTTPVAADQSASAITLRSLLPRLEAETLSGRRIVLPEDAKGRIGLLVFSFSRGAGDPARCWSETFARIGMPDADAASFGILMLGEVPRIIRGLVVAAIKRGMPAAVHDRTVKMFTDEDAWRARLGVQSADDPHLVLVDRAGRIRWLYSGACDGVGEQRLREQLSGLLAEKDSPRQASPHGLPTVSSL